MNKRLLARTTAVVGTAAALAAGVALSVQAHADETTALPDVVNVDSGGAGVETFVSDADFVNGGTAVDVRDQIGNRNDACAVDHTIPVRAWDTFRTGAQKYTFKDLPKGGYQIRLYFLDFQQTKVGGRVFDIKINGTNSVGFPNFDPVKAAVDKHRDGSFQGVEVTQAARTNADGDIVVEFLKGPAGEPLVNAISVVEAGKASEEDKNLPAKPDFCG